MKSLTQKTVLLTGAAGGIGTHIARALVQAKAKVVCTGRSAVSLDRLISQLSDMGGNAIAHPFDLQNISGIPDFIRHVEQSAGPIDVLINNAAIEKFRPYQDYSPSEIQAINQTNFLAPMMLSHQLLPKMLQRNSGHIVNISSGAGKRGAPFNSVYSATKAALINWSEGLRLELSDSPVNVSVVCPGITDAGMFHALETEAPEGLKVTPPEEVAQVVIDAILSERPEVMLDGLTSKVFLALSQFSPQLGDRILHKVGVVDTNRDCAERMMKKAATESPSSSQSERQLATADS